jgi:hypothetical protein
MYGTFLLSKESQKSHPWAFIRGEKDGTVENK